MRVLGADLTNLTVLLGERLRVLGADLFVQDAAGREIHLRVEADERTCRWIVQDQGCGMQPEQLARVFERFYRGDQSRDRPGAGTGLGLPIVAAIAQAHGGTVHAASRPGEGTVFTLELPYSG